MEERNFEYLSTKVLGQDLGFGEHFTEELRASMKLGLPKFNLAKDAIAKDGREVNFELTNFTKQENSEFYMLNGPNKLHVKNPETGEIKTGVFKVYYQKGYTANEMLYIMNDKILYKPSRENGKETHKIHFLASQPGPLKKKNRNVQNTKDNQNTEPAFTSERIFKKDDIKNQTAKTEEPNKNEYHVSTVSFKLSDLAKKFSSLPGFSGTQEDIENMMRTVLLGGTAQTPLTLPGTGERVDANITLSKGAGLNVRNQEGAFLNLKGETLGFTAAPAKTNDSQQTNTNTNQNQQQNGQTNRGNKSNKGKELMDKTTQQQQQGRKNGRKTA